MGIKISLAAARVNAGLTQKEAAKKIGVSITTIKNWEKGLTSPKFKLFDTICEVYVIPVDNIKFF